LAGLLGVVVKYERQELDYYLRIIGIKKSLAKKEDNASQATEIAEEEKTPESKANEQKAPEQKIPEQRTVLKKSPEPERSETERIEPPGEAKPSLFFRIRSKITGFFNGIRDKMIHIGETIDSLKKKTCKIKKEIADERNKKAVYFLLGKIFNLLKHLSPRRTKVKLMFSTGSPDTTGQVIGLLAICPFIYQKGWNITPDFTAEEGYAETDFVICGHIYGITILITAIQIICNKDCLRLYKKLT
jgi:hypothetical protein